MSRTDFRQSRVLASPNAFKLATFGFNAQGGVTITKAAGPPDTDWAQQVRIARASEAAGIEALIPGARWIGYGGETNFQGRSYEALTWAAGLSAATRVSQVFATVHFTTVHPVRLAKMIATADHILGGRLAINWVAGWNSDEIAMFGGAQREHDERYEFAEEYLDLMARLLDEPGEFGFHGRFFDLDRLYSEPKPITAPRVPYMAAGISPRGRQFAAAYTDINFVPAHGPDEAIAALIASTKAMAAERGRAVKVFGQSVIVCADSEAEAQARVRHYVDEQGDFDAARNLIRTLFGETRDEHGNIRRLPPEIERQRVRGAVASHGGNLIAGTPTQVVDAYARMQRLGLDGCTISFLDFEEGLDSFKRRILPLMIDAGLRTHEPDLTGDLA